MSHGRDARSVGQSADEGAPRRRVADATGSGGGGAHDAEEPGARRHDEELAEPRRCRAAPGGDAALSVRTRAPEPGPRERGGSMQGAGREHDHPGGRGRTARAAARGLR
ncbi:hypothetical protein GCM10009756_05530 [Pseudokineococcus marinus]